MIVGVRAEDLRITILPYLVLMLSVRVVLLVCICLRTCCAYKPPLSSYKPPIYSYSKRVSYQKGLIDRCKLHWRNATLDHFTWVKPTNTTGYFRQRVFICDENWGPAPNGALGPIFLYLGNEADVTLYLNHTGLMWENAPEFGALLVFAEHRCERAWL
eukprot:GHRR01011853.1.p1 GENE.GHRR01011853.1~~GHRR01011853.1.p1  ORF type:complete len:158 (+),score=7.57 GHRR01011853.1:52-525(+)